MCSDCFLVSDHYNTIFRNWFYDRYLQNNCVTPYDLKRRAKFCTPSQTIKKDELFSKQEHQRISIYSELYKKFHIRVLFIAAVNDKYVHIMSTHIATSFFWRGFFHSLHIHESKKIILCVFSCCWPVIKMDVANPDCLDIIFKSSI